MDPAYTNMGGAANASVQPMPVKKSSPIVNALARTGEIINMAEAIHDILDRIVGSSPRTSLPAPSPLGGSATSEPGMLDTLDSKTIVARALLEGVLDRIGHL